MAMRGWLVLLIALLSAVASRADTVTVRHALWDANQRPAYQRCATAFEVANPGLRIRLQHQGWDDYWTTLSTGFISNTAPDVFTDHITKHAEFVLNGVLLDLAPLAARDGVPTDTYEPGLMAMWQHQGRQYAWPTDWDTIALAVNLDHVRRMGVAPEELQALTWNPRDGGSLQRIIARLTLDEAGRHGADPAFDPRRVKVWGYANPGAGNMMGQTEWSHYAASAGFRFQPAPWSPELRYDDPVLADTLQWLASLSQRGWMPAPQQMGRLGADALFTGGRAAMVPSGSWMVGHFKRQSRFIYAWVPLPVGPQGRRTAMRNGLALAIWAGSPQREAAWRWVRFVGGAECQAILADTGVVFPAWRGLGERASVAHRQLGVDTQVFLDTARGDTFLPPIAPHGAEVASLVNDAIERILAGRAPAAQVLPPVARRVRELSRQP